MNTMVAVEPAKLYLDQLDLSYIRQSMCSKYYSLPRWDEASALTCEKLYKRFLWLIVKYKQPLVPSKEIDEFWHNHILYTKNYAADCEVLAGHYIHHNPSNPEDESEIEGLIEGFKLTQSLYEKEFGEPLQIFRKSEKSIIAEK